MNDNDTAKILCPFYRSRKMKKLRQSITITCENLENNMGFDVKNMLSFRSIQEREDWMGLFCQDLYQNCPYYQKIYKNTRREKNGNCQKSEKEIERKTSKSNY